MKNKREILEALINVEALEHEMGGIAKLVNGDIVNQHNVPINPSFNDPEKWHIKKNKKLLEMKRHWFNCGAGEGKLPGLHYIDSSVELDIKNEDHFCTCHNLEFMIYSFDETETIKKLEL